MISPEKHERVMRAVVDGNKTIIEVMAATGMPKSTVKYYLNRAAKEGMLIVSTETITGVSETGRHYKAKLKLYAPLLSTPSDTFLSLPAPTHERHRPLGLWELNQP